MPAPSHGCLLIKHITFEELVFFCKSLSFKIYSYIQNQSAVNIKSVNEMTQNVCEERVKDCAFWQIYSGKVDKYGLCFSQIHSKKVDKTKMLVIYFACGQDY